MLKLKCRAKIRAVRAAKPGACIPARLRFVTRHVVHTVVAVGNVAQGVRGRLEGVKLRRDSRLARRAPN